MISRRNLGMTAVLASAAIGLAYEVAAQAPHAAMPAQAEALPADLLRRMQEDPNTPAAGNSLGAITVTEFFDYRCPYCRTMQPVLEKLVAKDRRVRLVFKDWPIFGGVSIYAARVAIASQWQGKYAAVHKALFALPRAMDEAAVRKAVLDTGVELAQLDRDLAARGAEIESALNRTSEEAHAIGFRGTPGFVVGSMAMPGALSESQMAALVNQAAAP